MPVTSLQVAIARGATPQEDGAFTMEAIENVGIPFFGGCACCGASIAAHNEYPSKSGMLKCESCIGDNGFNSVEEFEAFVKSRHDEMEADCELQMRLDEREVLELEHPSANYDAYDLYGDEG